MKQRILPILLSLALLLGLLPTAAWASNGGDAGSAGTGDGDGGSQETVSVATWPELIREIKKESVNSITLREDATRGEGGEGEEGGELDAAIIIPGGKSLTINLNGHTLDTDGTVITVSEKATLTIVNEPSAESSDESPDVGTIIGRICVETGGTLIITRDKEGEEGESATADPGVIISGGDATDGNDGDGGDATDGNATDGSATNGGGIYVATGGTVTIQENANVEITGNKAEGRDSLGGGVYNAGTFTMNGGAIYGNGAGYAAADFYN